MRLVATETYLTAARAAGRTVTPKVSIKKTADRSELLSAGTWIDVTDYVSKNSIPTFKNDLEINLSQFSASKISLIGLGINYWDTNFFNYSDQLELKVEYILSGIVAEAVPVFAGWLQKRKSLFDVKRQERTNIVKFDVWSYPDYADEVFASTLLAQYIDDDIDGADADGLMLPHIYGLFVTDANITSYVLKKGVHVISYQLDGADKQARLDDGAWTTLTMDDYTVLINEDGSQKVEVYAKSSTPAAGEFVDDIIVDNPTDQYPKNWLASVSARYLLQRLFEKVGITSISYDLFEYPTADGQPKITFAEQLTSASGKTHARFALASDGTALWAGIGNKVYRRDPSDGQLVLKVTLANSGDTILKLMYNARNNHLWILSTSSDNLTQRLIRYSIGSNTVSNELNLTTAGDFIKPYSIEVVDYNYFSTNYKYCVVFTDANANALRQVDGSAGTLAVATIYTAAALGVTSIISNFMYIDGGNSIRFRVFNTNNYIYNVFCSGAGVWEDGSFALTLTQNYSVAAYHEAEDRIYYWDGTSKVRSHTGSSATITDVATGLTKVEAMHYSGSVYFVDRNAYDVNNGDLYSADTNTATLLSDGVYCIGHVFAVIGDRLFGIDSMSRLFQYADVIVCYIETADLEGLKVRGAIDKVCNSFNLVYKISSNKTARVQRRSDENGDVITTGNVVELTSDNMRDISDESFYSDAFDIVRVSNGSREVNFDGTDFDAVAFDQEKVHTIDSDWIPDEILEDVAFNVYPFFSTNHKVYLIPSPAALMQYECLDGATIVHTGKMTLNETGVIVSDSIDKAGRPEYKILVNA